jgi:hypothetical protein
MQFIRLDRIDRLDRLDRLDHLDHLEDELFELNFSLLVSFDYHSIAQISLKYH